MQILVIFLLLIFNFSCASNPHTKKFFLNSAESSRSREDYCAQSKIGMVATAHPLASEIGNIILQKGGNAVDAAVAASFAISVLRPQSTGIGGGGFMLVHEPKQKEVLAYDFRERAPKKASRDMYLNNNNQIRDFIYKGKKIPDPSINGHLSVGTPGLIAGLLEVHANHGLLPLKALIEPSINLAKNGFKVYDELAQACEKRQKILSQFEDSRRLFVPNGIPLKEGDWLIQSDLAWTLKKIARFGLKGFYEGPVAKKILAEMAAGRGILSKEDLESYEVKMHFPIESSYRGYRIVSMPPPSSGGVHIIEMLNILSNFDIKSMGHKSPKFNHLLAETMKRAFADRANYLGDPDFVNVPLNKLISPEHAASWARGISLEKATPAEELGNIRDKTGKESPSTTHISVVDKNGMAVSTTQTINYTFGSCVVARGTGIVLNDEMDDFSIKSRSPNVFGLVGNEANAIAARKTMVSSMSPTFVFDANNNLKLVVGSPGGPRIINATLQTIINVIDHKMSLPDAVHSFRIHHQWLPDEMRIEPGAFDDKFLGELKKLGHKLKEMKSIGDVQAIEVINNSGERQFIGVSDTRSNGKPYPDLG